MTNSINDEFIAYIINDFGMEGYGRWWVILETIASQMDKTTRCSVEYPWQKWQTLLLGKRSKLFCFLKAIENQGKINLKENGNKLEISCPNLLKYRDEYSQRSGQDPDTNRDNVGSKIQNTDTDTDTDTDNKNILPDICPESENSSIKKAEKVIIPYDEILNAYHLNCPTLSTVRVYSANRKKTVRARWLENPKHQTLDFWDGYFKYVATSSFLRGDPSKTNGSFWQADFEWLINSSNFIKVIEGKYHHGNKH